MQQYTAIIKQQQGWWLGWIEEMPGINCQEPSLAELRQSLKQCLAELIQLHRADALALALALAGNDYFEETIVL